MYKFSFPLIVLATAFSLPADEPWPDFRGPQGDGHSHASELPLTWSEAENVVWKTAIPGRGWSSPVVSEGQVWLTTATDDGRELSAVAVDCQTGKLLHNIRVFSVEQPQGIDPTNSHASPSPVIDRQHVYVHFGTNGTACLEMRSGSIVWTRCDLEVDHQKGPGSSPILYGDLLIFQRDGNDVQCLVALNKQTGETVWRTDRSVDLSGRAPDYRKSFSTPLLLTVQGEDQLVSTAAGAVYGYEPGNGRELWHVEYAGHTMVSRPVADAGMLVVNTGYPRPELWGIRLGGFGNVTDTHVAWKVMRSVAIKPSVILVDGLVYMVSDAGGVLTCLEAETGTVVWRQRLGGNYAASPLWAKGRLYFFSEEGQTTVVRPGRSYQELAISQLDDGFMASPAVAGKSLYLRTKTHLYRIGP